ncbi:MAG: HlyD family efflux transporter periplasmic adaptor subunit [Bauldia sp.]
MSRSVRALVLLAPLVLAGCFGSGDPKLQGYVEGTYVYLGAEAAGRLVERAAAAGQQVAAGDLLFRLDDADQKEAVAGADARLAQAQAQFGNLQTGKRAEEIGVIAAQLSEARTALKNADDDYTRKLLLREKGVVAQSVVDDAKARRDSAAAAGESVERQLQVARLPARPEELAAAERNVSAQEAALAQSRIALERRTVRAPADALVEETFYSPGELVMAGQPVVSLLPDTNRKIRFFLPEEQLSSVAVGTTIAVACDGCAANLTAEVDFVASQSEFTPPILYSKENRQKLVYRVEAKPVGGTVSLKVGQPVDITIPPAGTGS